MVSFHSALQMPEDDYDDDDIRLLMKIKLNKIKQAAVA